MKEITTTLTDVGVDSERIDKDTSQRYFTISATVGAFDCVLLDTLNCHHCLTEEEQQSVAEEFARRYKAHDALVAALVRGRAALAVAIKSNWEGATDADVAENLVVKQMDSAIKAAQVKP